MEKITKDYLIYTFLIWLVGFGVCVVCSMNSIYLKENTWLYIPFAIGSFSPGIASFITSKKNKKVKGFKDWLKNIFDVKQKPVFYLIVIVWVGLFVLLKSITCGYKMKTLEYSIIIMFIHQLIMASFKESGFRFVLQEEFEKKYNFVISTILVGIAMWSWHSILYFINGTSQYGQDVNKYFFFLIEVLGLAFVLAAIRKVTNSIWLCIIFYALLNTMYMIFTIKDNMLGSIIAVAIMIITSLVFVKINEKKVKKN